MVTDLNKMADTVQCDAFGGLDSKFTMDEPASVSRPYTSHKLVDKCSDLGRQPTKPMTHQALCA